MKRSLLRILSLVFVAITFPAWGQEPIPSGNRWLDHLKEDLLPFWTSETALGKPLGAFPSIRCDDGTLYNDKTPCPEVGALRPPNERYLVALSRQSFGYGVAFHLTGERKYLDTMKAGIDFIRLNAMDRANGGMATTQDLSKDTWGPAPGIRTPQQLAYGLLGMAFYYYLTGDPDVLQDVVSVKNYIFEKYSTPEGALQWQPTFRAGAIREDKQLVAQLDQMNTYLVLLTPLLREPARSEWKEALVRLSKVMMDRFYSPTDKLFFLATNKPSDRDLATTPTDFGHNAKVLWMIRFTGLITAHTELVDFAQDNAQTLLARAYVADCGCWAGGVLPGGVLDLDKVWWVYAELNQLAGTLALSDVKYARYLPRAYDYWFSRFVDTQFGEVWTAIDGRTHEPVRKMPKQWEWKNAYHSLEHALVGYIVAQALNNKAVTLYYAFPSDEMAKSAQPYYYSGKAIDVKVETIGEGKRTQKLTFSNVH
jgi:mannose/cellobiose epimerase-like protein (N-acyl-D-glucosamine 2-epimerase family)